MWTSVLVSTRKFCKFIIVATISFGRNGSTQIERSVGGKTNVHNTTDGAYKTFLATKS